MLSIKGKNNGKNRVKNFKTKNPEINLKKNRNGNFFLKKNIKKIFSFIIFFISIGIFFFIFFSNYFSVSQINFERKNFSFNPENISKDLEKYIGKNIFFINTSSIKNQLEEKNPQFKKISIKKIFPDTIYFEVFDFKNIFEVNTYFTEKNKESGVIEKYLQKFLISQSGQLKTFVENEKKEEIKQGTGVLKNADKNSNVLKKIFIKEDIGGKLEIGDHFLTGEVLSKIQKINSYLETQEKINIENIFLWPNGKELHFNTKYGSFYFTLSKDIDKQIEKIFYFKEAKNLNSLMKKGDEKIQYLDLRISEKIIYK